MTKTQIFATANGVFGTGLNFWELIGLILAAILAVVAIKIVISLDLNKLLERKDKRLENKIRNVCPHVEIEPRGDKQFSIQSLFESPPGTHLWQCSKCGLVRNNGGDYEREYAYWGEHLDEYLARMKEFEKLLKKGGAL